MLYRRDRFRVLELKETQKLDLFGNLVIFLRYPLEDSKMYKLLIGVFWLLQEFCIIVSN